MVLTPGDVPAFVSLVTCMVTLFDIMCSLWAGRITYSCYALSSMEDQQITKVVLLGHSFIKPAKNEENANLRCLYTDKHQVITRTRGGLRVAQLSSAVSREFNFEATKVTSLHRNRREHHNIPSSPQLPPYPHKRRSSYHYRKNFTMNTECCGSKVQHSRDKH
jgi:hypothetical protein